MKEDNEREPYMAVVEAVIADLLFFANMVPL